MFKIVSRWDNLSTSIIFYFYVNKKRLWAMWILFFFNCGILRGFLFVCLFVSSCFFFFLSLSAAFFSFKFWSWWLKEKKDDKISKPKKKKKKKTPHACPSPPPFYSPANANSFFLSFFFLSFLYMKVRPQTKDC